MESWGCKKETLKEVSCEAFSGLEQKPDDLTYQNYCYVQFLKAINDNAPFTSSRPALLPSSSPSPVLSSWQFVCG